MSDKHTQGRWVVQYQEGDKPFVVADQGKQWNNPVVCSLYEDVTPEDSVTIGAWLEANENAEANARLIAAAPDLLEALHLLVAGIENNVSPTFIPLQMARAAIAKAEASK